LASSPRPIATNAETQQLFWTATAMKNVLEEMKQAYGTMLETPYFSSGEQFWLAYVMWKRYKKIWSDSDKQWMRK